MDEIVINSGYTTYYRRGKRHRENGPAVEGQNGYRAYYRDGLLHRDDGPAIEYPSGRKEYWINGNLIIGEVNFA